MNKKNNRRFKAIDAAMKTAMMALAQEKSVDKISIGEICKQADVNRATFYAHYNDVYGLIEAMAGDLSQELLSVIKDMENGKPYTEYLLPYFIHIKKHRSFYKPAMLCRNSLSLGNMLAFLNEKVVIPRCHAKGITDKREIMYHEAFFQAGVTSLLKRWLEKDCVETETEMLAVLQKCLI